MDLDLEWTQVTPAAAASSDPSDDRACRPLPSLGSQASPAVVAGLDPVGPEVLAVGLRQSLRPATALDEAHVGVPLCW